MERHADLFSTVWYGVYQPKTGILRYGSAGHPPALLVSTSVEGDLESRPLEASGPCIGIVPGARFQEQSCALPSQSSLFVFSDGTYEISTPEGTMLEYEALAGILTQPAQEGRNELDALLAYARDAHGTGVLEDDFTIIRMRL